MSENETDDITKVYSEGTSGFFWNANDLISVFGSPINEQYRFSGATGDNYGYFLKNDVSSLRLSEAFSRYYAVYPYSSSTTSSMEGSIDVEIPSTQGYRKNSIPENGFLLFAVTDDLNDYKIKFKNAYGYLKLQFYGDPDIKIKSVSIQGNMDEPLSGETVITYDGGDVPVINMSESARKHIIVNCGEGVRIGTRSEPLMIYVALPPVDFSNGFTINVEDQNGNIISKGTNKEISIVRNTIKAMAPISMIDHSKPVIGLGRSGSIDKGEVTLSVFEKCISDAGGTLKLLSSYPTSASAVLDALSEVDALIIPGGNSLDPSGRDASDLALLRKAKEMGMPILGICHGHQFVNMAFGGSRIGVAGIYPNPDLHYHYDGSINTGLYSCRHCIRISPESNLYDILEQHDSLWVNTSHTACVNPGNIAECLSVVARCENDGLIESIESDDGKIMGTQFHPEYLYASLGLKLYLNIFKHLVEKAKEYKINK